MLLVNRTKVFHIYTECHRRPYASLSLKPCTAIFEALKKTHMKVPKTSEDWEKIADGFQAKWQFPHCVGAIDGKHVMPRAPNNSGSQYFNYKHTYSLVLMALADAASNFIYVDVGCNGRVSDGGVFRNCSLGQALEQGDIKFPDAEPLPGCNGKMPYYIVGDEAFPLKSYLQKPYPYRALTYDQRVFNYRLSRARRVIENAFGILASRFRVFLSPIPLQPENAQKVVLATCVLHNFLRRHNSSSSLYEPSGVSDKEDSTTHCTIGGTWRQDYQETCLQRLNPQGSHNYSSTAKEVREELCSFFLSKEGAVQWQDSMI